MPVWDCDPLFSRHPVLVGLSFKTCPCRAGEGPTQFGGPYCHLRQRVGMVGGPHCLLSALSGPCAGSCPGGPGRLCSQCPSWQHGQLVAQQRARTGKLWDSQPPAGSTWARCGVQSTARCPASRPPRRPGRALPVLADWSPHTDCAVLAQTWPLQGTVAAAGQLHPLEGHLPLHPHLWHVIRLSIVSTASFWRPRGGWGNGAGRGAFTYFL